LREFADRPFVLQALDVRRPTAIFERLGSRFEQEMMNHLRIEGVATLGRAPSFGVQDLGDLRAFAPLVAQLCGAGRQRCISAEHRKTRDGTRQLVRCAAPAMPMAFDADLFRARDDLNHNPFEQQAHNGLPLQLHRGFGLPERRQVMRQFADRREFDHARRMPPRSLMAFVFGLQARLFC